MAVVIASIALFQTREANTPRVGVVAEPPFTYELTDSATGRKRYFAYHRIVVTNNGGRAVTLLGLKPDSTIGPFTALRGDTVVAPRPTVELFRISESADSVLKDRNLLPRYRNGGFASLRVLNEVIPAGEARLLQLGLSIEGYREGLSASDVMLFAAILEFSNGDQVPFRQGYTLVK